MTGWFIGGDYDFWLTTEPEEKMDPYDVECLRGDAALARAEAEEETCD